MLVNTVIARKALSSTIAAVILVLIVVIAAIGIYMFVTPLTSRTGRVVSSYSLAAIKIEGIRIPSGIYLYVPPSGGETVVKLVPPLTIYVRNIGSSAVVIDTVYFVDSASNRVLLALNLSKPVVIEPNTVGKIVIDNITASDYIKLNEYRGTYIRILLGVASVSTSSGFNIYSTSWIVPMVTTVYLNTFIVVVNASDSYGWWVDPSAIVKEAEHAVKRLELFNIRNVSVVILNSSYDLYLLFNKSILVLDEKNNITVDASRVNLIIIDAHGEVLPIPTNYVLDYDGDGELELGWYHYARDIHTAFQRAQSIWILVTVVGAPLFYVSNKNIVPCISENGAYRGIPPSLWSESTLSNTLLCLNKSGYYIPLDSVYGGSSSDAIAIWSVEDDMGNRWNCKVRRGMEQPLVCELCRKLTYAILTGNYTRDDIGPSWEGIANNVRYSLQLGHENRIAMNGKSWHNFYGDREWGGVVALPSHKGEFYAYGKSFGSLVDLLNYLFGVSLPQSLSAARGVIYLDRWYSKAIDYLYGCNNEKIIVPSVVLHYDDFYNNSIEYLDAGLGRNLTYWVVLNGSATINTTARYMEISTNSVIIRHVVGWADYAGGGEEDRRLYYLLRSYAEKIVYSVNISKVSVNGNSGSIYILFANSSDSGWLAVRMNVTSSGTVNSIELLYVNISTAPPRTRLVFESIQITNATLPAAIKLVFVNATSSLEIYFNDTHIATVNISQLLETKDLNKSLINIGFATYNADISIAAPINVTAMNWHTYCGYASAVFSIDGSPNHLYIHGGYSPPYGVVKEYGYSWSEVNYEILAQIAVYFPVYLILKEKDPWIR